MRKIKETIIVILINLCIIVFLCSCGKEKKDFSEERVEYRYACSKNDYTGYLYYTDDYFFNDATEYNPSLATMSLGLAMSSFMKIRVNDITDYSHRYEHVEKLLLKIGYKDIYANEYYKKKPTTESLGLVIGSKKVKDYTIIAIGIRGAGYQQEWASNCKVGDGKDELHHNGFNDGATILLNDLNYYINQHSITGNIKIWSAGFSRASAVNNLAMGRIDNALSKGESILPNTVNVTKNDIFAYCFEVPMGASFEEEISPKSDIYNNIFNIINAYDPVPMVPMSGLGFTRYGIDKYLPNPLNDMNYEKDLITIKEYYKKQPSSKEIGDYTIDNFIYYGGLGEKKVSYSGDESTVNFHGGIYIQDFLNKMISEGIYNRETFKNQIQDGLMAVFAMIYQNNQMMESLFPLIISFVSSFLKKGDINYMIDEIMHNPEHFVDDILPIIKDAVETSKMLVDVSPLEFCTQIKGFIQVLTNVFNHNLYTLFPFLSLGNLNALAQAHQPTICMANLQALDPKYNSNPIEYDMSGGYYLVEIPYGGNHGLVDIYMDGSLVSTIYEGGTRRVSMYSYGVLGDSFVAYLPLGHSYRIETRIGSYSVKKYDPNLMGMQEVNVREEADPLVDEYKVYF